MRCASCENEFAVPRGVNAAYPGDSLPFCSLRCLRWHIDGCCPMMPQEMTRLGFERARPIYRDKLFYVREMQAAFRSEFEGKVAYSIAVLWRMRVFYEEYAIRLDAGHVYVPDFFLPDYGVALECKGEWRGDGQRKFVAALKVLGPERLLILPAWTTRWFRGAVNGRR